MAKVFLHGELSEKYGPYFEVKRKTVKDCIQIMIANFPALEWDLKHGLFRFSFSGKDVSGETQNDADANLFYSIQNPIGENEEIHITPDVIGAGSNGGIFMIIAGVIAVAAAAFTAGGSVVALGAAFSAGGWTAAVAAFGASMIVGGVAMMLTKLPTAASANTGNAGSEASSSFSSTDNMIGQGQAIALIYGENLVGSCVVSQQIQTLTKGIN